MAVVECTFNGLVGAKILFAIADGSVVYVFYEDAATQMRMTRVGMTENDAGTVTVATDVTAVS